MKKIRGNTWFHESAVCIGAFKTGDDLLVIDSGNDDSSARKAVRNFENIDVRYVFNTHSHADHCGGNSYFVKKYNSEIIAPEIEEAFICYPVLEPSLFYGAFPPAELKNKFLCAQPSPASARSIEESKLKLELNNDVCQFDLIRLNGHSPNMHGIITPDNIAFIGDALLGNDLLSKHGLMFSFDVKSHHESLLGLGEIKAEGYVLAHGGYCDDISSLVEKNIESLENVSALILDALSVRDMGFDEIHQHLFRKLSLRENLSLNVINRAIIRAHVQYLHDRGDAELFTDKGLLLVRRR